MASRSTSRRKAGSPTTPIRTTSSTSCCTAKPPGANNNNVAYFNDPTFNKQMDCGVEPVGRARYKAYGNLDVDMMLKNPPWAARNNFNDRILLSSRMGCFTFNPTYSLDFAALCLK